MKGKRALMMTGVVLAMSATVLPAFANVSHTSTQPLSGGEQHTQVSPKTGAQVHQQKWSLDDKGVNVSQLTPSEQAKFKQFKAGIEQGLAPMQAANKVGSIEVTRLNSTKERYQKRTNGQYQIRLSLSKKASATLQVDRQTKVVKVLQVSSGVKPVQTSSNTQPLLQR
jgi:hypothetical protein